MYVIAKTLTPCVCVWCLEASLRPVSYLVRSIVTMLLEARWCVIWSAPWKIGQSFHSYRLINEVPVKE